QDWHWRTDMYCNRCGNKVPSDSQFCNRCGGKIMPDNRYRRSGYIPSPMVRPARRKLAVEDQFLEEPFTGKYDDVGGYEDFTDETEEVEELETMHEEEGIFIISPAFYGIANQYFIAILLSIAATALIAYSGLPLLIAIAFAAICFVKPVYHHIQN